jgi:hypothetical protein
LVNEKSKVLIAPSEGEGEGFVSEEAIEDDQVAG